MANTNQCPRPTRRRATLASEIDQHLSEADLLAQTLLDLLAADGDSAAMALQVRLLRERIARAFCCLDEMPPTLVGSHHGRVNA